MDGNLFFARGATQYDGATPDSGDDFTHILGQVKCVQDRDADGRETSDGTGIPVKLRVVRADAALTAPAGKAVYFGTDAQDPYRKVDGLVTTAGKFGLPADEKLGLTQNIAQYDLFYVVEEGPAEVLLGGTVAAGDLVTTDASSRYVKWTGNGAICGVADEAGAVTERKRVLFGDKYIADRLVHSVAFTVPANDGGTDSQVVNVQFNDKHGNPISYKAALKFYLSDDAAGNTPATASGNLAITAGTDGAIMEATTDVLFVGVSEDDGTLDVTVAESTGADTYYLNFILPTGQVVTSSVITFTA